jgi:putative endonuclease
MSYHVYILTNQNKTSLYTGVTNNLEQRILEHYLNKGNNNSFAGRYYCYFLVYYEAFQYINSAIEREKEIKSWVRIKKEELITLFNPQWDFLNKALFGNWPPIEKTGHRNS